MSESSRTRFAHCPRFIIVGDADPVEAAASEAGTTTLANWRNSDCGGTGILGGI